MSIRELNEADVRAEIADPMLLLLGYKGGTDNDILREVALKYKFKFLGRKKPTDLPIKGIADYIATVNGFGRWTLETKSSNTEITHEDIEQAISYSNHPEICAAYSAVLNGRKFILYHRDQKSTDSPTLVLDGSNPEELAKQLRGLLSPPAIKAHCKQPVIDLSMPLSDGLRSSVLVTKGTVVRTDVTWECTQQLKREIADRLTEGLRRAKSLLTNISGGKVFRDKTGSVRASVTWSGINAEMQEFIERSGFNEIEYVSLSPIISNDPENPTIFEMNHFVQMKKGDSLFDIIDWQSNQLQADVEVEWRGQVLAYIKDGKFYGTYQIEQATKTPINPVLIINTFIEGSFELFLDGG